ncbi:MAG: hypothetical protein KH902_06570 [Subdoligranulum variabile]|uniref:hypothetical protein n=1 Tax=Gemmiger sp. TaxID=2049027 RepID=UPI00307D1B0C|nr:hypothetical protein [Subdoligranulum variabile]
MSYANFVPKIWAKAIERELERKLVFAEDCNRQYEGDVKQMGDTVKILGVGKPTISKQKGGSIILPDAENVEDTSVEMQINTVAYFNFLVDDIDKRQAVGGLMDALNTEATQELASEMDKDIAALAGTRDAKKLYSDYKAVNADNVLGTLDLALQMLQENDVPADAKIVATVPPWFLTHLRTAYTKLDTDNSDLLKNGKVGRYNNILIKMSNNVYSTASGSNIMVRTERAVAFANPLTHTEPYRPEKRFSDAVKGYVLYGTKIVRPKELMILNVKNG